MIPIRQHNDIVGKLIKELQLKQGQINSLVKQKNKLAPQQPQLQPSHNELNLTKKLNQLNKEHKERVNTLTQQLRSKSIENKDLKERLTTKQNIEAKQKQHISQILKKTYDRKPSSGADYKISALISHYQAQIEKKNKFIQSLQKQLRESETNSPKEKGETLQQNENYKIINQEASGISLTEHQKQLNQVKIETNKYRKLYQQKDKQYKDLVRRYTELTNQYYKIVNNYGIQEPKATVKSLKHINSETNIEKITKKVERQLKTNALQNLLTEMVYSESETQEGTLNKKDFTSKVASIHRNKFMSKEATQNKKQAIYEDSSSVVLEQQDQAKDSKYSLAVLKLQQILQYLQLSDIKQIVPKLIEITKTSHQYSLINTITRSLQVFFYNIGKGKLTKEELVNALQDLEISYNRDMEAVDILDEACIEAGAKRQKLREKIMQLSQVQTQYFDKLKSIKMVQDLARGNKVLQFIDFFSLDKEEVALPQQLGKVQDQLKSINKFIKQAKVILQIVPQKPAQQVLQLTLRYLQKTSALVSKLQRKKQKKIE